MNHVDKIVTSIPMTELWDASRMLEATKERYVGPGDIEALLRTGPIQFVVANVGDRLRWIDKENCFIFWKNELREHLHDEGRPYLEDYPGAYFYFASEWHLEYGERVILLEKHH